MTIKKNKTVQETPATDEILKSIDRSLNLLVKLKLKEVLGESSLNEMILLLHSLGNTDQ